MSGVSKQSAAESAGFAAGDRICAVDGHELGTTDDLHQLIRAHKPGDKVEVRTQRDIDVELGQRPDQADGKRSVTGMGGRAFGGGAAGPQEPKGDGKGLFSPDSKPGDFWTTPQQPPRAAVPGSPPAQPRKLAPTAPPAKKRAATPGNADESNLAQLLDEIRALRGEVADLRREISKLRLERESRQDPAPRTRSQLR